MIVFILEFKQPINAKHLIANLEGVIVGCVSPLEQQCANEIKQAIHTIMDKYWGKEGVKTEIEKDIPQEFKRSN